MTRRAELITIEQARAIVLEIAGSVPIQNETVGLAEAEDRVLLEPVSANAPVPGFDNSAMDGFAVRSVDLSEASGESVALQVVDESRAGHPAASQLRQGEAIAISTGAMVPAGADAVVMVEDTTLDREKVEIRAAVEPGANIRRAGEDIGAGAEVIGAGTRIGPAELGVAASVGAAAVECARRPRVAVLATGDELRSPDQELEPGQIHDSNAWAVPALARRAGAEVASVTKAPDQPDATTSALAEAIDAADLVAVCGGVSVGEHDHVKGALEQFGVIEHFWGVALKPGKPTWFGVAPGSDGVAPTLVFGLPGNPVSAMVTFILFAQPALAVMQGADPQARRSRARLASAYPKQPGRAHAVRCQLILGPEGLLARPAPAQGSHVLTSMLGADALVMLPAEAGDQPAGAEVVVEVIGDAIPGSESGPI